jgi:OmpW family
LHLPPTFRPYVGAGINYARISSVNLRSNIAGVGLELNSSSRGGALRGGVDIKLPKNLFLNVDVKKIYIDGDVKGGGVKVSSVKFDPLALRGRAVLAIPSQDRQQRCGDVGTAPERAPFLFALSGLPRMEHGVPVHFNAANARSRISSTGPMPAILR